MSVLEVLDEYEFDLRNFGRTADACLWMIEYEGRFNCWCHGDRLLPPFSYVKYVMAFDPLELYPVNAQFIQGNQRSDER